MTEPETGSGLTIRELLDRHETGLVTYVTRLVGDVERARDVVQDTFMRLLKQGNSLRSQAPEVLARWLFTTARNRALDVVRKEQRMRAREQAVAAPESLADADPQGQLEKRDQLGGILRFLAELPANQQEALRLKYQQGLSYRQIAEVMDQSLNHVGVLLHHGLHALRRRVLEADRGGVRS